MKGVTLLSSSVGSDKDDLYCLTFDDVASAIALPSSLVSSRLGHYLAPSRLSEQYTIDRIQGPVWHIAEVF